MCLPEFRSQIELDAANDSLLVVPIIFQAGKALKKPLDVCNMVARIAAIVARFAAQPGQVCRVQSSGLPLKTSQTFTILSPLQTMGNNSRSRPGRLSGEQGPCRAAVKMG
jgi:hypothetical protein